MEKRLGQLQDTGFIHKRPPFLRTLFIRLHRKTIQWSCRVLCDKAVRGVVQGGQAVRDVTCFMVFCNFRDFPGTQPPQFFDDVSDNLGDILIPHNGGVNDEEPSANGIGVVVGVNGVDKAVFVTEDLVQAGFQPV